MTPSRAAGAAPPDQRPRAGAAPPHQPRPPGTGHRQTADHHQRNEGTGATPERPKGPGRGRHRSPPGAERAGREAEHKPEGRQHSTFFVTLRKGPFPPLPGLNQIHRDSTQTISPYISIAIKSADTAFPLPPDERKFPPLPVPPPHGEASGAIPGACMPPIPPWDMCPDARVNVRAKDIVAPGGSINFDSIRTVLAVRY